MAQNGLVPSHIETPNFQQFKYRKSFLSRYQKSHFTTAPSFLPIFLHNNLSWIPFFFLILSDQYKLGICGMLDKTAWGDLRRINGILT